jgi:hypothetical protein
MPKDKVNDLITDQEIAFARLILAGETTDQQAAEAAGLNPTTAAYTKAKPRVQAWMEQYRAAMDKLILEQEAENLRRRIATRGRVLDRLWLIADLSPEQTRNSMVSQMKALAMIVAIEGLIPDRKAAAAQKSIIPAVPAKIYQSEWLRKQNAAAQSSRGTEEDPQENDPAVLETAPPSPQPIPKPDPGEPVIPQAKTFAQANSSPYTSFVPDTVRFFEANNPFSRWRR